MVRLGERAIRIRFRLRYFIPSRYIRLSFLSGLLCWLIQRLLMRKSLSIHDIGHILSTIHVLCLLSSPCTMTLAVTDSEADCTCKVLARFSTDFFLSILTEYSVPLKDIGRSMVVVPCFYGLYIYEVCCEHDRCSTTTAGSP